MTSKRRMIKASTGSFGSDGDVSTVIDAKQLPQQRLVEVRVPYQVRCGCGCGRMVSGEARSIIDIAPAILEAVDNATTGEFSVPAGSYEAQVVSGYRNDFLSGVLRRM